MSQAFTKIDRDYWQDTFIMDLAPEEKYFYIYLMTNSRVNALGCYELRMKLAVLETGYNEDTIRKYLQKFSDCKKIIYDQDSGEVYILNWAKYNWNKKTATVNNIHKHFRMVKSESFRFLLAKKLEEYGIYPNECREEEAEAGEQGETKGNKKEQEGTTGNFSTEEGEGEREEEGEKEIKKENADAWFETFWQAYPNKKNKKTAKRAWDKLKVTPERFVIIMEGLERAKKSREWAKKEDKTLELENGDYIPHPSTWLNAEGWANQYHPLLLRHPKQPDGVVNAVEEDEITRRMQLAGMR